MEATSKASSIPLISIVGKGRGDDGQEFLRLKICSARRAAAPSHFVRWMTTCWSHWIQSARCNCQLCRGRRSENFRPASGRCCSCGDVSRGHAAGLAWTIVRVSEGDVSAIRRSRSCLPSEANRYGRSSALRVLRFQHRFIPGLETIGFSGWPTRSARRRRCRILSMEEFEAAPDRVIASLEAGLVMQSSRTHFRRCVHEALQARTPTFRVGRDQDGIAGLSSCRAAGCSATTRVSVPASQVNNPAENFV